MNDNSNKVFSIEGNLPLISVVVPYNNREKFLDRCIESIINQTYINLEIILVNDNSTDKSESICKEWSTHDKRIKNVSTVPPHYKSAGAARNCGIKNATGDFIVFVDSDDYVSDKYIEHLFKAFDYNYCNYVVSGVKLITTTKDLGDFKYLDEVVNDRIYEDLSRKQFFRAGCGPYCKLFVRSIIIDNGLEFDEKLKNYEDCFFNLNYVKYVDSIAYNSSVDYYYDVTNVPAVKRYSVEHEMYLLKQFSSIIAEFPQDQIKEMNDYKNSLVVNVLLVACKNDIKEFADIAKECSKYLTMSYSYTEQLYWRLVCSCIHYKLYILAKYLCNVRIKNPKCLSELRTVWLKIRKIL